MGRTRRSHRLITSLMVATVATLAVAGTTFAHECFNDSRTARADVNAANGNGWSWTSEVLLQYVIPFEILHLDPLSDEDLEQALAIVEAEKASGEFDEIYALDRAVLSHTVAMQGSGVDESKLDDDRAIEHASADESEFGPLVERLIGIYFLAAGS